MLCDEKMTVHDIGTLTKHSSKINMKNVQMFCVDYSVRYPTGDAVHIRHSLQSPHRLCCATKGRTRTLKILEYSFTESKVLFTEQSGV